MKVVPEKIPVVAILGPTAVGKSSLALRIARERGYEIISCDSRQIYQGMDIGTAKPSRAEQAQISHHLIDIRSPNERYSASDFASNALAIIRALHAQGKRALICGGTGLYYQALSCGLGPAVGANETIRRELERRIDKGEAAALFDELARVDPAAALNSHAANVRHTIRQLEIYYVAGVPPSKLKQQRQPPADIEFYPVITTCDRAVLYERINKRVDAMMAEGLYEEYAALRSSGIASAAPGFNCVGYKELCAVEQGTMTTRDAVALIKQHSRHYAKRQFTWFNNQLSDATPRCAPDYATVTGLIEEFLRSHA